VTSLRPSIFEKKTKKKRLLLDFPAPRIEFWMYCSILRFLPFLFYFSYCCILHWIYIPLLMDEFVTSQRKVAKSAYRLCHVCLCVGLSTDNNVTAAYNLMLDAFATICVHLPVWVKIGEYEWEVSIKNYLRFCVHLEGKSVFWDIMPRSPLRVKPLAFTGLHVLISQKIELFVNTAVRTSNPAIQNVSRQSALSFIVTGCLEIVIHVVMSCIT
jgi:hypothetical protein